MMVINRTEYNTFTGCPTASMLLERVRWWYQHTGRHFYKFNAPCDAPQYKPGDSWVEELNISYSQFTRARAKIATRVRKGDSMTDLKAVRRADGTLQPVNRIVLYYQDKHRRLWYWLNVQLLEAWIAQTTTPDPQNAHPIYNEQNADPIYDPGNAHPIYTDTTRHNNQTEMREGTERYRLPAVGLIPQRDDDDGISLSDSGEHMPPKQEPEQPANEPASDTTDNEVVQLLAQIGVHNPHDYADCDPAVTRFWVGIASDNKRIQNPAGFVVDKLRKRTPPPSSAPPPARRNAHAFNTDAMTTYWATNPGTSKFISGQYAAHIEH